MPAVLELPKQVSKQEEFVEKQLAQVQQRIRLLDWFSTGLMLLIGLFAALALSLLIDRYVETPAGTGWAVLVVCLLGAGGYVYWALYRPARRDINPFYAARQVEQTIPDAKNSVINYVDLKDEEFVPGSVKTAIGNRAAKDLKHVDLNRAIQRKQVLWLGGIALFFFLASVVMAFLPPTRTTLKLMIPKDGNTTVVKGEDVRFEVEIKGRIPVKGEPDVPRVRIWYNPEDPATYEERPLEQVEGQRSMFALTVPARQVRNGFHYKVLAGNAQTADFEVKLHIVPEFTGWIVEYEYPEYLGREPRKDGDPNLVGYYNTMVTVTALTNRPVKSGEIKIDGVVKTVPGTLLEDNPEAIRFRFPMVRNSHYWIRFTTTEGHTNPDPQRYRLSLVDPKPAFLNYEVTYDYPKYLRAEPVTINVREPNLEAIRGTKVTIVANANRPIRQAKLEFPGRDEPIVGTLDAKKPMQAKFVLPPMMENGKYRVVFSPKTDEKDADARAFDIMVLADEKPKVRIDKPMQEEIELPANGILPVEGFATDDVGIDKMTLRLEVVSPAPNKVLKSKEYRGGISFRRESDNSYPGSVEYKDFVELTTLKPEGQAGAGFKLEPGMVIDYWLEAIDNCDVPPGPNMGMSQKQRVKITAPVDPADMKKKNQNPQQQKAELEKEQRQHEQKQDQQNRDEKRDPKQPPPPKGDPQEQKGEPEPQPGDQDPKGDPQKGKSQKGGKPDPNAKPMGEPGEDEQFKKDTEALEKAANPKSEPKAKTGMEEMPPPRVVDPKTGKAEDPPPATKKDPAAKENPEPKSDPTAKKDDPAPKSDPTGKMKDVETKKEPPGAKDEPKPIEKKDPSETKKEPIPMKPREIDPDTGKPKEPAPKNEEPKDSSGADQNSDPKQLPNPDQFKQLADKLKSDNEREREEAREQLKKMMDQAKKEGAKPDDQQKKAEEHRNKLDEEKKQEFDEAMKDLQKEMQKLNQEERVKKAAEKAQSNDEQTRKQGQEELERELQREQSPGDVERQLQNLATNQVDEKKKQKLDDAKNLLRKNREEQEKKKAEAKNKPDNKQPDKTELTKKDTKDEPPPMPKKEDKDVDRLTKKMMNKNNEQERKEAQKELEKRLQDPMQREQTEKDLKEAREKLPDEQAKKDFDKEVNQARENAEKNDLNKLPKPEDIQKFADKLNSDKKEERDEAKRQLEDSLKKADDKDPKASEQAQKQLEQIRDKITDQKKKEDFDKALKDIDKAVQEHRQEQKAQAEQQAKKDAEQIANDLNSKDEKKQQAAQDRLNDMVKDPKKSDAIQKELEKQRDKATEDSSKQNIDKALADARDNAKAAKKDPLKGGEGKVDPKEIEKLAKELGDKDSGKQQAAKEKLDKLLQDPKTREEAEKELQRQKEMTDNETAKQNIEKVLEDAKKKAEAAKNDPAKKEPGKKDAEIDELGKDLKSGNPVTEQAAKDKLEEKLKDPKTDAAAKKDIEKLLEEHKKAQTAKKEAAKTDPKEAEELLKKMNSKDPKDAAEAAKKIEELLKDPAKRAALEKQLEEMMKDPKKVEQAMKNIEDQMKKQIDQVADKMQKGSEDEQKKAAEKLEDLLKDPKNREFIEKQLENFKKNLDGQALKDFEKKLKDLQDKLAKLEKDKGTGKEGDDITKHDGKKPGENATREAEPGSVADLKNKVKAGELLLEKFKKPDYEGRQELLEKMTEQQLAEMLSRYEKSLAALKKQIEAMENGEMIDPRNVKGGSNLNTKGERIKGDKDGDSINAGGKPIVPPGFEDPYRRFTGEISGVQPIAPKK